jgi:hypothetical protein
MHIPSFEDTLKNSYSHGLEEIYTLETIDPKTIRPLNTNPVEDLSNLPSINKGNVSFILPQQREFDFGSAFRSWIVPFILDEPIHSLNLTGQLEKALLKNHYQSIKDLLKADLNELAFKGIGQGHIDEMRTKLKKYVASTDTRHTRRIDFVSLLKVALGSFDKVKIFVLLEPYRLQHLFHLMPLESVEARKLKPIEKEAICQATSLTRNPRVEDLFQEVYDVYIATWIHQRHGLAQRDEVLERLERASMQPELTQPILAFFNDLWNLSLFNKGLKEVEKDLFALDIYTAMAQKKVVARAKSYFYTPEIKYSLDELTYFLLKECAQSWEAFSEQFIHKVLLTSTHFQSVKHAGKLSITL